MSKNIIDFSNLDDQSRYQSIPWTPEYISTIAWYDASDSDTITESSGSVSQWDDKSGNGHHLTQGSGSSQPSTGTRTVNTINVIDFNGSSQFINNLTLDYGSGSPDIQIISLVLSDGDGSLVGYYYGYSDGTSGGDGGPGGGEIVAASDTDDSGNRYYTGRYFNGYQETTKSFDTGQAFIVSHAYPAGGTHIENEIYIDGSLELTSGNNDTRVLNFAGTNNQFSVGAADSTAINFLDGAIGEILMFNSVLSDSDRQKIEGYLAHKWGLEGNLPSSHPYRYSYPIG
jgi:hypothetical protein